MLVWSSQALKCAAIHAVCTVAGHLHSLKASKRWINICIVSALEPRHTVTTLADAESA